MSVPDRPIHALRLLRLYLALNESRAAAAGAAGRRADEAPVPGASGPPFGPHPLISLDANRRAAPRMYERGPVEYSECLGGPCPDEEAAPPESDRTALRQWLFQTLEAAGGSCRAAAGTRLVVHLEESRGELLYCVAVLPGRSRKDPGPSARRLDISLSGMCFPTRRRHERGETLRLALFLRGESPALIGLEAEVVRPSRPSVLGGYSTAVSLLNVSERDREAIASYILVRQRQRQVERVYRQDPPGGACPCGPPVAPAERGG
ncbi:MAG: PilZ domain-containing protein [bacterium]